MPGVQDAKPGGWLIGCLEHQPSDCCLAFSDSDSVPPGRCILCCLCLPCGTDAPLVGPLSYGNAAYWAHLYQALSQAWSAYELHLPPQ